MNMHCDELLYPEGTLVAYWALAPGVSCRRSEPGLEMLDGLWAIVMRVDESGRYRVVKQTGIIQLLPLSASAKQARQAAEAWAARHGYVLDDGALPGRTVPRKIDVIRAKLREVAQ